MIRETRVGHAIKTHSKTRLRMSRAEQIRYTTEADRQFLILLSEQSIPGAKYSMNHDQSEIKLMQRMPSSTEEK